MEKEYKIDFIVDGEPFDPNTLNELYGWYKSKAKDREKAIRNLVEKVRKEHPDCNVLVLGDFIQTRVYWQILGYAARTQENPNFIGNETSAGDDAPILKS